jgi:Phytanoyl-CoA dioxygenase (PhyH)
MAQHPEESLAMTDWIDATPTQADDAVLTREQIASWRERGYALVSGLFPITVVDALRATAVASFPAPGTADAAAITDFGSGGRVTFPSRYAPFNAVTLHPRLLTAIGQLLGVAATELRLTQADLWPKYGRRGDDRKRIDNDDQRMHVDYPNHTLAHPPPWHAPEAVELILYFDRVEDCGGATAVVPRDGNDDPAYRWPIVDTPGVGDLDWLNDRSQAEADFAARRPKLAAWRQTLYARERRVRFAPGDVLLYRHDTWHRGTPLLPGRLRLAHNITYRLASAEWISTLHTGWAWSAYSPDKFFERLIAQASLAQHAVLGFPQPGAAYWNAATLAAVEARYGAFGIDMTPYRLALANRQDAARGG